MCSGRSRFVFINTLKYIVIIILSYNTIDVTGNDNGGLTIVSHPAWTYVMDENQLPEKMMTVVFPYGLPVLLVKNSGRSMRCQISAPTWAVRFPGGSWSGLTVKCPCHDWMFDLQTGGFVTAGEIKIPVYESKVEEHKIYREDLGAAMKKVSMYTLSTCPWCRKTKKFFKDKNIQFEFIDYDLATEARAGPDL